ncbi:hypothetical protein BJY01DRAFT_255906 [Aspergillus pseudoustus]|uniref:Uncharacterized protein n=1 Tax=Aspergillus pseudoustus TaxID=1810923 RepID=A0ABR4IG54_9EURO
MSDFEKRYLTVAVRPNAQNCTPEFIAELYDRLLSQAPGLRLIAYPLLASVTVGARRPDFVPHLFEAALANAQCDEDIIRVYNQFSGAIITILPSVGGPWCNPAMMGLANILKGRNFGPVERLSIRPLIAESDLAVGNDLLNNRYTTTKDPNVQALLSTYCPDYDNLTRAVALGYCHVGTTNTGVFKEHETELILAAALAGAGATRSATVHGKTSLSLGNLPEAVRAIYEIADAVNTWNLTPTVPVDLDGMFSEMGVCGL